MEPFHTFQGLLAKIERSNIDTDQIIPKQFLKAIGKTGFGENLFFDWRYLPNGGINPDFELNQPKFRGASILVAGNNFGCGSSREHAVWAIQQYGFKAVIAPAAERSGMAIPAFADIFRNNTSKNGLLAIELSEKDVRAIWDAIEKTPGLEAAIDLAAQEVLVRLPQPLVFRFQIESSVKERLLGGLDDIGLTLRHEDAIRRFEASYNNQLGRDFSG